MPPRLRPRLYRRPPTTTNRRGAAHWTALTGRRRTRRAPRRRLRARHARGTSARFRSAELGSSAATIAPARCGFLAAKVLCGGATVVGEVGSLVVVAVSVRSVRPSRLSWLHPFSFHGDRGQRARQSHHADFQVHDDRKAPRDRTFTATTSTDQPVSPADDRRTLAPALCCREPTPSGMHPVHP